MKNLNQIYNNDELLYYCNTCGEVNIPGTNPMSLHESDELPLKERNLYENYWTDNVACHMYVVKYQNHTAMALGFLFDEVYLSDIMGKNEVSDKDMNMFYNAICDYTRMLEKAQMLIGCEVLVGEYTDPDGHELLVIIPYEQRSNIENIAKYLEANVYSTVEQLL